MIERRIQIYKELDGSIFLFGARQTGKSTMLRHQFPDSIYIDLLDTEVKSRFIRRPVLLFEMLNSKPEGTLVIIDEIPEVPELLNEVHRLIVERRLGHRDKVRGRGERQSPERTESLWRGISAEPQDDCLTRQVQP